jgi:hypothetical protein
LFLYVIEPVLSLFMEYFEKSWVMKTNGIHLIVCQDPIWFYTIVAWSSFFRLLFKQSWYQFLAYWSDI